MKRCPLLDVKLIPLTQGKFAIVDEDDFKQLAQYNWCVLRGTRKLYAARGCSGKALFMHRTIISTPKHLFTDHINGNGLDNRKCNLRICTKSQNGANGRKHDRVDNSSLFKGVSFQTETKRWRGRIVVHHKQIHLGYFDDEVDAAKAYDAKAVEFFGEFARTNFGGEHGK